MVQIQINRQPNANIVETVARIKALMPQFQAQLPPTVRFKIASDRTITTRDSLQGRAAQRDRLHRAGDFGGVRLSAQRLVDLYSEHLGAGVHHRHLRRDVPVGVHAGQSLADGADHCHGIRGGRCHRGDRKHYAPHRKWHEPDGGCPQRRRRDRFHRFVDEHLADRGLHSHPDDERRGRAPVPRIRGDSRGRHRHLHGGLAHRDSHDVRVAPQGRPRARISLQSDRENSTSGSSPLMHRRSRSCSDHPASVLVTVLLTMGVNVYLYDQDPEGIFPAAGYRASAGRSHGPAAHLLPGAGGQGEMVRGKDPYGSGCRSRNHGGRHQRRRLWRRELGHDQCSAQTGGSTKGDFGPGDRPPAPPDFGRARGEHVPAELTGRARRRSAKQRPIPVHPPSAGLRHAGAVGAEGSGAPLGSYGDCGRQLRPAELRLVLECDDRPRYRVTPRPHGASRGLRACTTRSASARSR